MKKRKIAFVVQRCGREVNGGAEAHCLAVAQRMAAHWDTEVLTTCAIDYVTWANAYPPGQEELDGVVIRRFPVTKERVTDEFGPLSEKLHVRRDIATLEEQESWMSAQGPYCPDLVEYIETHSTQYDAFIFFTYLYWHTYTALPKVAERSILVPLAHDEWPIYLGMFKRLFATASHLIFNTIEEKRFVERLFPATHFDGPVVGVAIDRPAQVDPTRFRRNFGIQDGFLLYLGRIDSAKGCQEMFDYFVRNRAERRVPTRLVLLGKPVMAIPTHPDIVSLGFVSEETKWDALAACDALVMPSPNESLSMVLLEAWSVGKPVVVNGRCEVLVGQCRRSNGGLWYESYEEWVRVLETIQSGRVASVLGRQGWRYVRQQYSWVSIERAYLDEVEALIGGQQRIEVRRGASADAAAARSSAEVIL